MILQQTKFKDITFYPRSIKAIIPDEWKVDKLKNYLTKNIQNGITKEVASYGSGYLIVEIDALYQSDFYLVSDSFRNVPLESNELKNYTLSNNDFLINRVSKLKE